jgi:hypothetical protein
MVEAIITRIRIIMANKIKTNGVAKEAMVEEIRTDKIIITIITIITM